jgi:NADH-quinone oxidoreductase subunit N
VIQLPAEQIQNLQRLAPEIVLCLFGIVIMIVDPILGPAKQRALGWLAFLGTLAALGAVRLMVLGQGMAYNNLISADAFSIFVHLVVIGSAALAILGSMQYLEQEGIQRGEY